MYKLYDYQNKDYMSENGITIGQEGAGDQPAKFDDKEAAEKFLYNYNDEDRHRFDVTSAIDARNQGIPLENAFAIHEDTMHDDLKEAFELYYDGKLEVSFDTSEGHVAVMKDEDSDRYGVAYINLDSHEVSSKGAFEDKDQAMEFADDIKEYGMDMEKTDITEKDLLKEEEFEISFDR